MTATCREWSFRLRRLSLHPRGLVHVLTAVFVSHVEIELNGEPFLAFC